FDGASKVTVKANDLELGTQIGTFAHGKLYAYQVKDDRQVSVPARFVRTNGDVGFSLGAYDHSKPLVIDPVVYGSYYGGDNGWDDVTGVAADANGNVYMTGWTQASLFPITTGPYFTTMVGFRNAFVARLQGDAYNIDFSAFFGGSISDSAQYINVDQFGNVWISGVTNSPDFPGNTKVNTSPTQNNMFLMRWQASQTLILDPITNPAVLMLGYDGGAAVTNFIDGVAIVPDPNPGPNDPVQFALAGQSNQTVPEVPGSFTAGQGWVLRYTFAAGTFTQAPGSMYIGDGLAVDIGGIAVDNGGNVYLGGDVGDGNNNYDTTINNGVGTFVTTPGVFTNGRIIQKQDMFLRKYSPAGAMIYSCVIGGSSNEFCGGRYTDIDGTNHTSGTCVAIDSLGDAFITGICNSFDYPRTRGAYGEIFDAYQNVVVTKISPDASQLVYSTNLKAAGFGEPLGGFAVGSLIVPAGIAVDPSGKAYITGNIGVASLGFPASAGPVDPNLYTQGFIQTGGISGDPPVETTYPTPLPPALPGPSDFLNVLDPTGTQLFYGTYLGGGVYDIVYAPFVDSFGDLWVFGETASTREYLDPVSGNIVTDVGALPAAMITPLAFKATGDAGLAITGLPGVLWGDLGGFPPPNPPTISLFTLNTDGWLCKFDIGQPIVGTNTLTPNRIPGGLGASTSCSLTLTKPAPVQGATITLSLLNAQYNQSGAASFDPNNLVTTTTVNIPGGATAPTSPITIYSEAVTSPTQVLVRAYYQGNFLIAPLSVVPWLTSFQITPSGTVGGNSITGTVLLANQAPAAGVTVSLQASSAVLTPPATVTIPAGQQSATFNIGTAGVDSKSFPILTASLLGAGISQVEEVDPASITSVVLNPIRVSGLTQIQGTATLNGLPGPNFPVTPAIVVGTPAGYVVTPGTLTFSSGGVAGFTIQTPYEPATITRTLQVHRPSVPGTDYIDQLIGANFTVDTDALVTFTLDKSTANPGDIVNGTVSLGSTADTGGAVVSISADSGIVGFATPVVIPAGSSGATFQIQVGATVVTTPTTVHITATRGPTMIQRTLMVNPSTMSLSLSLNSVLGGNSVTGTVSISNPAPLGGLPVNIMFSPPGLASTSGSITIPAGQLNTSFTINTVPTSTTTPVTITVSSGSISAQQVLTVRAPSLTSISFTPSTVVGLRTTVCKITLDGPATAGGTVVTLSSSNPLVATLPPSVTILAGKTTYVFTVLTRRVSRPLSTTVTASTNSTQASATFTVVRY
ncbi:MAG TPA: SBBP repeat-containing protein, partial [Fimbriimonadaceae bacterium]|nr:SBBP repeat-containing protein [Fimbriimonadaceae bacterium]